MPKLVISLAYFEDSSDAKPQRVANIGFMDNKTDTKEELNSRVRFALKESGILVFEKEFPVSASLACKVVQNGREFLYVPNRFAAWLTSVLRRNAATVFSSIMDMLLHSKENDIGKTGG